MTGLRLGELLALRRSSYADGLLSFESSAHEGDLVGTSEQKNHERSVPVPPSLAACSMPCLPPRGTRRSSRPRAGTSGASATSTATSGSRRRIASGLDPTPHEFRHSYITHLRAAGIDDADLARVAGHRIETMISVYTHPLEQSHDAIRAVIG